MPKSLTKFLFQHARRLWQFSQIAPPVPKSFIKFAMVGCTGILVNLAVMAVLLRLTLLQGWIASGVASLVASINNYILNNIWTFSDRLHTGFGLIRGYLCYLAVSTVGVGITTASYAGLAWTATNFSPGKMNRNTFVISLLCQLVAIFFGAYFNYVFNKTLTWPARVNPDADSTQ